MMTDLSQNEINELLTCALNRRQVIRPASYQRRPIVAELIGKALMEAVDPADVANLGHYPTIKPTLRKGAFVRLTEAGRGAILALNPADFAHNRFWPLPGDVQAAQERVRDETPGDTESTPGAGGQ